MFSTILDKVTGFFDRRALVSSFFPSLVFWMVGVAAFIALQMDWQSVVKAWDKFSITIQLLLLFAFFTWVTFWSFLNINFRAAYTRLLEGYWPNTRLSRPLIENRRGHWKGEWKKLDDQDNELRQQEETLRGEQSEYKRLKASLGAPSTASVSTNTPSSVQLFVINCFNVTKRMIGQWFTNGHQATTNQVAPPDAEQVGKELDAFLNEREAEQPPSNTPAPQPSRVTELQSRGQQTRDWWVKVSPWLSEVQQNQNSPWPQRFNRLEKITVQLSREVDQHLSEVEAKRQALYRELFLYYPPDSDDIMPTRLGNVLKAAELYAWERYSLDSVLIWSRLQSSIPDAFSSPFQDAKTSLDLMTTLSAFILLFGLPLAVWIAVKSTAFLPWWVPLILVILALLLPLRLSIPVGLVMLACLLIIFIPHLPLLIARLQVMAVLLVSIFLLFWLSYQNAVQAALEYGEKIKAAFDLYRWQVLEGLHLQMPKDLEEERKIWMEVDGLLARSYLPDAHYYRYDQKEKTEKKDTTSSSNTG